MVDSATVSLTVKVATPDAFVVPDTVVIVEEPPDFARLTALPGATLPFASRSVTVTVELLEPSAVTDAGAALRLDAAAVGTPGTNVTVAVCVTVTESSVSVAV